jgi:hypothetical protein
VFLKCCFAWCERHSRLSYCSTVLLSADSFKKQAWVADALERPNVIVHIFSDDPDYLDRYSSLWAAYYMREHPPRVSFGPYYTSHASDRSAAASSMTVPKPIRRTSVVDFAVELVIMVQANMFVGTSGSSVATMVEGMRSASNLGDRHSTTIGRWPVPTRCTQEAANCIQRLAIAFCKVRFDPEGLEILPEQRAVLDLLMPHVLTAAHVYIEKQLARGVTAMSLLGRGILDAHSLLKANRDSFRSAVPDSATGKRWLSAMLAYRMNPFLADTGKPYKYTSDGQVITKVDTTVGVSTGAYSPAAPASGTVGSQGFQTQSLAAPSVAPTSSPPRRRSSESAVMPESKKRPRVVAPPSRATGAFEGGSSASTAAVQRPLMQAKPKVLPAPPPS